MGAGATETHAASVLVVEDNDEIRRAIIDALERSGYEAKGANDGREALAELEAGDKPDVILLDLMMPGMSGWEFRVEQRLRPQLAAIPVIAMSSATGPQAKAVSADAYLPKPFEPTDLVTTVERVVLHAERSRLHAQVAQAERLRALGVLAAGVAHEINNPLQVVTGNAGLARAELGRLAAHVVTPEGAASVARLERSLADLSACANRITEIVRGMALLGRPEGKALVDVDLREAVAISVRLTANEIKHRARLVCSLHRVPNVRANHSKLIQVFVNLLVNAAHAIPEGNVLRNEIRVVTGTNSQGRAVVDICDTGVGMTPDVLGRIFEPFFTTRPIGQGMGLGLSISHELIAEMGGELSAKSQPGRGTTFRVELPASHDARPAVDLALVPPQTSRDKRVLIIDDEPQLGTLVAAMLDETYDVTVLTNPRAALDRLLRGDPFDVVLCDLMMPDLSGMDLHAAVRERRPELAGRFIFMTGGAFTQASTAFVSNLTHKLLAKPFAPEELARSLAQVLTDGAAAATADA